MSYFRLIFLAYTALMSSVGISGCATNAQTAAATAAGLLGLGLASQAATNSRLEVRVDMYGPTPEQRANMQLTHPPALLSGIYRRRAADLESIAVALNPAMTVLRSNIGQLDRIIEQLGQADAASTYTDVIATLKGQRQDAAAAVESWLAFDNAMIASNFSQISEPAVLDTLKEKLLHLQRRLLESSRAKFATSRYITFLKFQISGALRDDIRAAKPPIVNAEQLIRKISDEMRLISYVPSAPDREQITEVLDRLRKILLWPTLPKNHDQLDEALSWFGFTLKSSDLISFPSRESITGAITPGRAIQRTSTVTGVPGQAALACDSLLSNIATQSCSEYAYEQTLTFNRITAGVNFGPISNEIQQVLQAAGRSLNIVTDPINAGNWRSQVAYAKSDGGPGNHNSIIYLENMGMPIVKSSKFDPTQFVVAQGTLYRQVFSAAVGAFGAPLASTAGPAGAPDMQSSNVIATRAKIRNSEKATAAARQQILDTLKIVIDENQKVAKVAKADWDKNKAAIIEAAQKVLQNTANQLEAASGGN